MDTTINGVVDAISKVMAARPDVDTTVGKDRKILGWIRGCEIVSMGIGPGRFAISVTVMDAPGDQRSGVYGDVSAKANNMPLMVTRFKEAVANRKGLNNGIDVSPNQGKNFRNLLEGLVAAL